MPKANVKALRVAVVEPLPGMRLGIAQMLERGGQYRVVLSVACGAQRKHPGDGPTDPARTPM